MIKALLVEDERITRNGLLKHIPWKELGIDEIRGVEDAETAIEMSRDYQPHIIISDIHQQLCAEGVSKGCHRARGDSIYRETDRPRGTGVGYPKVRA